MRLLVLQEPVFWVNSALFGILPYSPGQNSSFIPLLWLDSEK